MDEELRRQPGYKEPTVSIIEETAIKSATDLDCGYINQERKKGIGYLTQMTTDTENGIILGLDFCPANQKKSSI